jgi:cyclohexa-1,5-dienecarbonyl-CoA hydratase
MERSTQYSRVSLEIDEQVARLGLENPPLNVIDIAMMEELTDALTEIESHRKLAVLVISGTKTSFSAGADVAAHKPERIREMLGKFHTVIRGLLKTGKVTVAAVQGHCLGGGAELAMVCDLVYTTESSRWGFPEIKLGFYPPVACAGLAALVGVKRAAEFVLTGRVVGGSEAAQLGLATRAVPDDQIAFCVDGCVQDLLKLSPAALAFTKKAFYAWDAMHFDKGLAKAEHLCLEELVHTEDASEGINAFLEKREPQWKGK